MEHITEKQRRDLTRISERKGYSDGDQWFRRVYDKNTFSRTDKECLI